MWIFCPICGSLYTNDTTTHMDWHAWLSETVGNPPWQELPPAPTTPEES